jgi:MoxR-like ATPase
MNLVERLKKHFDVESNVLITGAHGVGKTSIIKQVFEDNGLVLNESWLYFSGSTLDPWVDFIGIPKEIEYNGKKCIEIIPPKAFIDEGKIQAIFIDEFNRSPSKIRNALLELCQFKSINGRKFPNLKVVWAAINPEDEENTYDVERLDPAQKDRFPGNQIFVPYACDTEYFNKKYGNDIATTSINWWNDLPENIKKQVSPRRLDYALEYMAKGIPLEDILPKDSNPSKLRQDLSNGPIDKKLSKLYETKNVKEAKLFLNVENNYVSAIKIININEGYKEFFVPLLKKEKLCLLIADEKMSISDYILANKNKHSEFKSAVEDILTASTNPKALMKIRSYYASNGIEESSKTKDINSGVVESLSNNDYINQFDKCSKKDKIKIVLQNFPDDPNVDVCEKTMIFIVDFVVEKWEATIKQYDLDLLVDTWNRSYVKVDKMFAVKISQNLVFKKKCEHLGIINMMKGIQNGY